MKERRLTLNAEKRKAIADVFQSHWEREQNPMRQKHIEAIQNYDAIRPKTLELVNNIVRKHQPQEHVDTIREMTNLYGRSGGELHNDNCFYFQKPTIEVDEDGNEKDSYDEVHIDFTLDPFVEGHPRKAFAFSYYRDELKSKGLDPDFDLKLDNDKTKRNPRYYEAESQVRKYLGFESSNDVNKGSTHANVWDNADKIWVIGSSYCHSRQFKVDDTTFKVLQLFKIAQAQVVKTHEQLFHYVENKMQKLRLGLKSYKYFDQAKALADKLGIPLNESVLNESSSMALSVYSPENLASLLEDKEVLTREQKIAFARQQLAQQSVN